MSEVVRRVIPTERVIAGVIGFLCLVLLLVSSSLKPDPAGHGTHRQLGLPACGMVAAINKPCPTCGMTTAFAHAANGNLVKSFTTQPAGCLGAVCVAGAFCVCLYIVCTGSRAGELVGRILVPRVLWIAAGVWFVSWVYTWVTWTGG